MATETRDYSLLISRWESICCPQPQTRGSTRGSGGVVVLYKEELHDRVHVVHKDVDARHMWIRIKRGDLGQESKRA